ncbi:MAG: hypothetical protein KAI88_06315, partial [Nitrosomonadaceae bacterium]|nr:hypothetical protein [Nitrosomonadaceae bacterium]
SIIFYWIVAVIMAGAVSLTVYAYGWYLGAIWGGIIQFLSGNPKATVIPSFISSIPKVTILIIPMVIGIIMKFKKISGLKCGLGVYEMLETHPEVASLLSWLDQGMMMGRRVFPSDDEEKKHEFDQNQSSDIYLNMKSESPSGNSLAWTGLRIMILSTTVIALITVVMWTAVKIRFLRDFIVEMGKLF